MKISTDYREMVCKYLKGLAPDTMVEVAKTKNPEAFTEAVKQIIDLRLIDVEFTNDYKKVKRLEDINYERYIKRG